MASKREEIRGNKEIPDTVVDHYTKKKYTKGRFLGKGGFAKCYELTEVGTNVVYAGKIVSKSLLTKQHQKEKMSQEIAIHRSLKHQHVVGFHGFFEDDDNVYIILELCRRRSLMEMHRRRKAISEPEARYFLQHILLACKYLHENKVIHRDLKLGNLFLNDQMEIKVGDFGLATKVDYDGERKKTLCGTPNYIAPEVLAKKGHSFEVDCWSIGCILYTLLIGRPPFETSSLKETYMRIKKNEYHIPSKIVGPARSLIQSLLQADPQKRPSINDILQSEFIAHGYIPSRLPVSCLATAPRFDANVSMQMIGNGRKPLLEINKDEDGKNLTPIKALGTIPEGALKPENDNRDIKSDSPGDYHLSELHSMLASLVNAKPVDRALLQDDEAEDPAAVPIFWVGKWVDYTDKYGLGYQLCDNSVGILFNDCTKLILLTDGNAINYIDKNHAESFYTLKEYPETLNKKVTLLNYFKTYMNQHLLKAGETVTPREGDELIRLPYLRTWFRTRSAIVLHLTNGTVQINFFQDHTKVILCPLMGAVSYIDQKRNFHTYRLKLLEKNGCSPELFTRLKYAKGMVERLMQPSSGSDKPKAAG